jgi:Cof subfamily protein (haloacid dehalogenase superfamily)
VDGTLLGPSGVIEARDRAAIIELRRRGVRVTICTGRLFSGTKHLAAELGLEEPLACVDGSHIVHSGSGEELACTLLPPEGAHALLEVLDDFELAAFAFSDDRIFHQPEGAPFLEYVKVWSERTHEVKDLLREVEWHGERARVAAVIALGPKSQILGAAAALKEKSHGLLQTATFPAYRASGTTGPSWGMVVRAAGVDKGTAIEWLSQHYGVATSEIVAVGDWINDLPMLRSAGRSFAMAQAPDEVKAAVHEVLEADNQSGGGIAEAARRSGLL